MINLFENFDHASLDLLRSERIAKFNIPSVAINDNGFLPAEIDTPVKYFCQLNSSRKPLYFDQVPLPNKYWRIQGNAQGAQVMDLTTKRADIKYRLNDNSRLVQEVVWYDRFGKAAFTDHYDQHGFLFAKTLFQNGVPAVKKYFNHQNEEVIVHLLQSGNIFLNVGRKQRHFADLRSFLKYFLELRHYDLDHVIYNSLNQSLQVSLSLPKIGEDILFWHEKVEKDNLPGNMKFLMDNETRTRHVVFQRYNDWQRLKGQLTSASASHVDFQYLGMIYPHPRANQLRATALIFTNSDQVVHLKELVQLLPNVHFSVAALTDMSDKLLAFNSSSNVSLYPRVTGKQVKQLVKDNDIYLDINKGNEIVDAVRGAFEQNMLILGFKSTLHQPMLIADENVYGDDQTEQMAQKILSALVKPKLMKDLIDTQRREAGDVNVDDYQRVFDPWLRH